MKDLYAVYDEASCEFVPDLAGARFFESESSARVVYEAATTGHSLVKEDDLSVVRISEVGA